MESLRLTETKWLLTISAALQITMSNARMPFHQLSSFFSPHLGNRVQHKQTFTCDSLVDPWVEAV